MEIEVTQCPGAQIPKLKTVAFYLPTADTLEPQWGSEPEEGEMEQEPQGHWQQPLGGAGWSSSAKLRPPLQSLLCATGQLVGGSCSAHQPWSLGLGTPPPQVQQTPEDKAQDPAPPTWHLPICFPVLLHFHHLEPIITLRTHQADQGSVGALPKHTHTFL